MDVVRTCCKPSRIHHAFTALSLRPHYVHTTSFAFSPRPYHASSTFIQSPRRLHCVLFTSLRFLTRSYPIRSRFLLRPPRLIESFNHFQGGGGAQWLGRRISDQGVPGSNPGRCTFRCGLEQVTFTLLSTG